jgi:pimeloyl-ACP methyl ester carboxylesterase
MINPTPMTTTLIGAMLSVLLVCGSVDLAVAAPATTSSPATAPVPDTVPPPAVPRARAYLFRGALGPIFSRGMDGLTERIEQAGITADVYEFTICRLIAAGAIRQYREDPAPIILIGHSMGGYCALIFSEMLGAENIPVGLVVTIDPPQISPDVPLNIERYINIFLSKSVLGGSHMKPKQGFRGHYASFDLSEHDEVSHINIEKKDNIQEQLLSKVMQVATMPTKAEGDALPLNYVVPPDAAIELWDSGMPVFARPGDSLQTIAAFYHVPLWSVTQVNKGAEKTPLVPGERVIVPRHLVPLAEASGQPPPKR